ncbi:C-type lectin domain family 2 member L isoform 3-T3 [Macrochelys suwanniensis]
MCSRIFIRCQGHWCSIPPGAWRCLLARERDQAEAACVLVAGDRWEDFCACCMVMKLTISFGHLLAMRPFHGHREMMDHQPATVFISNRRSVFRALLKYLVLEVHYRDSCCCGFDLVYSPCSK